MTAYAGLITDKFYQISAWMVFVFITVYKQAVSHHKNWFEADKSRLYFRIWLGGIAVAHSARCLQTTSERSVC